MVQGIGERYYLCSLNRYETIFLVLEVLLALNLNNESVLLSKIRSFTSIGQTLTQPFRHYSNAC